LLSYFKIKNTLFSYHKFNEKKSSSNIVQEIKKNKIISLVSDAGTPTISDPGIILINQCIEENLNVCPIPGPSAVTSAISVSGFNSQYLFYGFLTKKEKELDNILKNLSNFNYSIIFFIPAKKINFYISQFKNHFSDRKILIAREMTKIHEEFTRGEVKLIKNLSTSLKGELTVVLSEKTQKKSTVKLISESVKLEIMRMIKKYSHKDVVEFISKKENLPKKIIYDFCLKYKKLK
jgi:16S rRNA (cytidine1402-2'-O)-methyltransferase